MSTELIVLVASIAVAFGAFAYMFALPRPGIWPRTWVAAAAAGATAVVGLAVLGRFRGLVGPFTLEEVGIGLLVGGAWLVITHVGFAIISRLLPAFGDQVRDLYQLGGEDSSRRMVGPIVAMGIAEELLFRGLLQGVGGIVLALAVYTAVQVFERKWALALAALLGGVVWGLLFEWRGGVIAPAVAHVVWTGSLTFVWPLGGAPRPQESDPGYTGRARDYASGKR